MIHDTKTAVMTYYKCPEIGTQDIMALFMCSRATAQKLKAKAKEHQNEKGILTFSSRAVNTKCAYEAWDIDIAELEKRYKKLKTLEKGGKQ